MRVPKILSAIAAIILLSTNTSFAEDNPPMAKKSVEEYATAAQGNYTGLIVDCRGLGLKTAIISLFGCEHTF